LNLYPAPNNTTYWVITTGKGAWSSLGPRPGQPHSAQFTQSVSTSAKQVAGDPSGTVYFLQVTYTDNGGTQWVNRQQIYVQP